MRRENREEKKTPRLRFPEFRKAVAWAVDNLADVATLVSEKIPVSKVDPADYISTENLLPDYGEIVQATRLPEIASVTRYRRDDVLISNIRPYLRKVWRSDRSGGASNDIIVVRAKPSLSEAFLSVILRNDAFIAYVMRSAKGVKMPRGDVDAMREYPVAYPEHTEQHKIANCLTSLDEVIAAQGRKVEALKAHKRGLMQQLFPREGETRPRLRFPEFRDAAEWVARPLGELMSIGSSRRVHESDWTTAGVPFYRAREIVALAKGESISPLFISENLYAEFVGFTGEIEEGQLLVTGVGSIGVPYLVKKDDRFYFKDGNIIWLKNRQVDISGGFLLRLFESQYVQDQIVTMAGIGTVGTYTIENAKRTVAVFPADKREQQRIADCLSSLDAQITAESNQLTTLKTHKQGLMQQLFPAPETASA